MNGEDFDIYDFIVYPGITIRITLGLGVKTRGITH